MRYELASPGWLAATRRVLQSCLDTCVAEGLDTSELTFSICEVSDGAPAHLSPDGARVGWHCRVASGRIVAFESGEAENVDYRMIADYEGMKQMSAYDTEGDPERAKAYGELTRGLYAAGRIQLFGRMPRLPRPFIAWHDAMARQTL